MKSSRILVPLLILGLILVPTSSIASTAPTIVIKVYGDGSIVVEGQETLPATQFGVEGYGAGFSSGKMVFNQNDFMVEITGYEESPYNASSSGSIEIEYNRVPEGGNALDTVKISIEIRDASGNFTRISMSLYGETNPDTLNGNYSGRIIVTSTSSAVLNGISNLTSSDIGMLLGGMGITVSNYTVKGIGNSVEITFAVNVDYRILFQNVEESRIRDSFSRLAVPITLSASFKIFDGRAEYYIVFTAGVNVNEFAEGLINLPNSTLNLITGTKLTMTPSSVETGEITATLYDVLRTIHDEFMILPSKGSFSVRIEGGVATVSFKTPRLLARNVTDLSSSIRSLYKVASKFYKNVPQVMDTVVRVEPVDFPALIMLKGNRVNTIRFRDLPKIEIIPQSMPATNTTNLPNYTYTVLTQNNTENMFTLIIYGIIATIIVIIGFMGLRFLRK